MLMLTECCKRKLSWNRRFTFSTEVDIEYIRKFLHENIGHLNTSNDNFQVIWSHHGSQVAVINNHMFETLKVGIADKSNIIKGFDKSIGAKNFNK